MRATTVALSTNLAVLRAIFGHLSIKYAKDMLCTWKIRTTEAAVVTFTVPTGPLIPRIEWTNTDPFSSDTSSTSFVLKFIGNLSLSICNISELFGERFSFLKAEKTKTKKIERTRTKKTSS